MRDATPPTPSGDPSSGAASYYYGNVGSKRRNRTCSNRPRGSFLTPNPAFCSEVRFWKWPSGFSSSHAAPRSKRRRRRGGFAVDSYVNQLTRAVCGARCRRASRRPDPHSRPSAGERAGAPGRPGPSRRESAAAALGGSDARPLARDCCAVGAGSSRDRDRIRICCVPAAGYWRVPLDGWHLPPSPRAEPERSPDYTHPPPRHASPGLEAV